MTQDTEQKARTREYGEAKALKIQRELRLSSHDLPALARHARQCFEEGAEEQRRKEGEGQQPVAWQRFSPHAKQWLDVGEDYLDHYRDMGQAIRCLYTAPTHVARLVSRIAELTEAEQLARADAEASKANAGWNFLTENVSSDPELPSCRLSTLFQEGDELSRFQRAAQEFGIEVRLVADDREDEDCDKELSAEILSKFDPCQFLIRDGWSFVDVWENDDGGIIRLFARAALTREGEG